jgi:hypothetical protein
MQQLRCMIQNASEFVDHEVEEGILDPQKRARVSSDSHFNRHFRRFGNTSSGRSVRIWFVLVVGQKDANLRE